MSTTNQTKVNSILEGFPLPVTLCFEGPEMEYSTFINDKVHSLKPQLSDFSGQIAQIKLFDRVLSEGTFNLKDQNQHIESSTSNSSNDHLEEILLDTHFTLNAVVDQTILDLETSTRLKGGQLIPFNRTNGEAIELHIENPRRLIGMAEVLTMDGNFALRLLEVHTPTVPKSTKLPSNAKEPYLEFRLILGKTSLSLRNILALSPGAVLKLDTSVYAPSIVQIGETTSMDADIVVVQNKITARILPQGALEKPSPVEDTPQQNPLSSEPTPSQVPSDAKALVEVLNPIYTKPAMTSDPEQIAWVANNIDTATEGITTLIMEDQAVLAAKAMIAMGSDLASKIFSLLDISHVELLTFEIARISSLNPEELTEGLTALYQNSSDRKPGGIEYARELLELSLGGEEAVKVINRLVSSLEVRPFDFIRRTDPLQILTILQQEHPQVIALICSFLEPSKAAILLSRLPQKLLGEVATRISTLGPVSCEVLREVERSLEKSLSLQSEEDLVHAGGVGALVEIINLSSRSTETAVLNYLKEKDPELAELVTSNMFVFEDIILLDDTSLQRVIKETSLETLVHGLKTVDTKVQEKFFRNMTPELQESLRSGLASLDNLPMVEVETAQHQIVGILRGLEERGEIVLTSNEDLNQ